jgi:hypothetical protein
MRRFERASQRRRLGLPTSLRRTAMGYELSESALQPRIGGSRVFSIPGKRESEIVTLLRHRAPVRLSRRGCSFQFGRGRPWATSPHGGEKYRRSALSTAWWWLMVARCNHYQSPARHVERPHAEFAHVAERHRLDWLVEAGHVSVPCPAAPSRTARPCGA